MADETPNAQGEPATTEAATQGTSSTESQQTQFVGFNKRIDELTAKVYAADKRAEDAVTQNTELLRLLAERQVPQAIEVPPDIDHDEQKKFTAMLSPYQKRLEQQISRLESALAAQEYRQMESQVQDPVVVKRANELMAGWRRAGHQFQPIDALTFAAGEIALKQRQTTTAGRDAQGRFNAAGGAVNGGSPTVQTIQPTQRQVQIPVDLNSRAAAENAMLILEKELAGKAF